MLSLKLPLKLHLLFSLDYFLTKACRRSNGTVNRRLHNLFDLKTSPSKTPRKGVSTSDTIINSSTNLWFRLYTPHSTNNEEKRNLPIIIYFHGGGFAFFSASSIVYDIWCRRLSNELQAVIVSVNYRLAPEHKFPSQYEDGFEALNAGGNLAHHVSVKAGELTFSKLKIIGLIAIQPFFGGEERTEADFLHSKAPIMTLHFTDWYWKMFLPDGSDRDHPAANVFGHKSSTDISQVEFPETLLLMGGFDMLKNWQRRSFQDTLCL
ncbi:hypothetical protein Pint_07151 [Pistacia integerrima]|uniref:Uncharacterized protein n=1 Tax=Pistacia integerrima TaxID=434235 RepID=A0ACC0XVH8_9ROSI|nr:hypothetical protein Pint_07151 [Pistacia integerrima]